MPILINADKWPIWYVCIVLIGFASLIGYMIWDERH